MIEWCGKLQILFPITNRIEGMDDLPLFPNRMGGHLSKDATLRAIRFVMTRLGEKLTRPDGKGREAQRFGEHVMRVAGAQFFARRGIDLFMIQLYARWGSAAVLKYVQDAPLAQQASVAGRLASSVRLMQSLESVRKEVNLGLKTGKQSLNDKCRDTLKDSPGWARKAELEALVSRVEVLEGKVDRRHRFVMNMDSFCVHKVLMWEEDIPKDMWETVCHWKFGTAQFEFVQTLPEEGTCDRCWRRTKCDRGALMRGRRSSEGRAAASVDDGVSTVASSSDPEENWV